ncbi:MULTISPECIES: ATP-binding protein [Pseudomonadota]|uniref:ATP-binding protein n=1 Tax=Pseudomonadota TaxID=1224 RepID=UPI000CFD9FCE|nr:ATP-binding protein [Pseudomonas sp. MYb185]PRB82906.1 two-component sensor histidine kinase [Pseudomonas sp. MYb185]
MTLRLRLLLAIGISLTLLWSLVAGWLFMDMRRELQAVLDNRLQASARMVAGLIEQMPVDVLDVDTSQAQIDIATLDGLACEVSIMRGQITSKTLVRTQGGPDMSDTQPGFGTYRRNGNLWRVYVLEQGDLRIATADRMNVRDTLLQGLALSFGLPFAIALVGSLLLSWRAIGKGLQPFDRIRALLAGRDPGDLSPLPTVSAPPDLQPLVDTIHDLLQRVAGAILRERQFTDDAAHELRTPLTAIKTHLQVARLAIAQGREGGLVQDSLASAEQGAVYLQETLDQLLLLARLDSQQEPTEPQLADVTAAARQAGAELTAIGLDADTRIRLVQRTNAPLSAAIPHSLMVATLRNLLDNALRYSPSSTPVDIDLSQDGAHIRIAVQDQGPGIADDQIAKVTERFWRAQRDDFGSGLGLSIVRLIVDRHQGTLALSNRSGGGLTAEVVLPCAGPAQLNSPG